MQNPRTNPQFPQKLQQQESPQIFRERLSNVSEFQHISPIPTLSMGSSDTHSQNTNEKSLGRTLNMNNQKAPFNNLGNQAQINLYGGEETPSALAKEFYKRPSLQKDDKDNDFYFESYENSQGQIPSNKAQEIHTAIKFGYDAQYLQSNPSSQVRSVTSKGMMKDLKAPGAECTDFDLTAKEISSNKRFDKSKKNTIISGRANHSPIDNPPSNSETVKWAFSNKDSQETQKKISIINRESINTQDMISKSLKSHDSRSNQMQQQTSSNSNIQATLKGKMLDFANLDPQSHQVESGLFYTNNKNFNNQLLTGGTDHSEVIEEQKVLSFFKNEEELLLSMQKKIKTNAQSYQKSVKKNSNQKFLPSLKFTINEALRSLIDNTIECPFCNEQKLFDSSLQCSRLDGPKSCNDILKENLERKYLTSREYYNVKIINDIIYNEQTHIVSVFKDYLIYDDISEFLKRFYMRTESIQRLPKMFEFYEKYSKVFPNYVILPENKYLFKNIEKKQRIIDEKQRYLMDKQEKLANPKNEYQLGNSAERRNRHKDRFSSQQQNSSNMSYLSNNRMFDSKFINSVANIVPSGFIDQSSMMNSQVNCSKLQEHIMNSSILIHQQLMQNMDNAKKRKKRGLEDLDFDELISKFIAKDTESNIQQSTIMLQSQVEENRPQMNESKQQPAPLKKKQAQIYDYQEKKVAQHSSIPQDSTKQTNNPNGSDNLKSISGQQQSNESTNKRNSTCSQKQQQQQKSGISDQQKKPINEQAKDGGKVLNYNFISNYNQIINNENYYINSEKIAQKMLLEQQQQATQVQKDNGGSRQGSLQRNQSKNNLHQNTGLKPSDTNCQTPSKATLQKDVKTPTSGDNLFEKRHQNIQSKYLKSKDKVDVQQPAVQSSKEELPLSVLTSQNNRSSSSLQKSDNQIISASPLNNTYGQKTKAFTGTVNTCRAAHTEAIVSRELSKEKKAVNPQMQNQKQLQNLQGQNQMFKNEYVMNVVNRIGDQQQQQQQQQTSNTHEYNTLQQNVRSIERLKNIEEEIEKDFSKYVNEYGLTKTAFAKAVNQIRDKQLKINGQNTLSSQTIQTQPSTTRQARLATNSNEKKRLSSNNGRSGSTSQQRKVSNTRQQTQKINIQAQDTANELYMNTNSVRGGDQSKQIRSVRTKNHLSSQNSSGCMQRSGKLSPDKNYLIQNQFSSNQNNCGVTQQNQTQQLNQTPSSGYITLKAQPSKQKGIKIKFPLNNQKEQLYSQQVQQPANQNTSQNQTPKRIKLQKTKSTSNIPISFTSRGNQQQASSLAQTSRGRQGGIAEMVILDELSQQMSSNNLMSQNIRGSQNLFETTQHVDPQVIQNFQWPQSSNSCVGTYATTSILNSPLSFKNQHNQYQVINQQRQSSKGRQTSRNGNTSQHQSQKSIGGNHQRASSSSNLLQVSNSKIKAKGEPKRMSAGSNMSKKTSTNQNVHHQPTSSNFQQQILQLLMSYQNQDGDSTMQSNQYQPFQSTLKSMNINGNNNHSMKDLKTIKQPTTLMKDIQLIKAQKTKASNQVNIIQNQGQLNTQRQGQPGSIMMLNQNFKKTTKSGKSTQRGDSKKRIQQQNLINPYLQNETNMTSQYSQMQMTGNEVSSRLFTMLGGDSTSMSQAEQARKILSYSKSQENLDLIKFAAQRAAFEQQQLQIQAQQSQLQPHQLQSLPSAKFLQNIRTSDNTISLSKIKVVPSSNQVQQSARNLYDPNTLNQFRTNTNEYELQQNQASKGPTNIIIGSNFERPQSRRTSAKFNPSSTKNQQS